MTNINERIGYEMRSQRLLKRMTLAQMADRLGKSSRNTIINITLKVYSHLLRKTEDEMVSTITNLHRKSREK